MIVKFRAFAIILEHFFPASHHLLFLRYLALFYSFLFFFLEIKTSAPSAQETNKQRARIAHTSTQNCVHTRSPLSSPYVSYNNNFSLIHRMYPFLDPSGSQRRCHLCVLVYVCVLLSCVIRS